MTRIDRDELANMLKGLGAKVTGSVSKKTTHLLAGDILEDGRAVNESSKYKKASELKTKIISFDELQELVRELSNDQDLDLENMNWKNSKPLELLKKAEENKETNKNINLNSKRSFGFLKSDADGVNATAAADKMNFDENNIVGNKDFGNAIALKAAKSSKPEEEGNADLWTTKYIPKSTKEIIGNQKFIKH